MPPATGQLHRDVLSRILAVARHLSASADLQDILHVIIDAMRDTLNADRATVFEYDPKTNELFTTVAHGVDENKTASKDKPREIRIPATKGLAGECAQSQRIINVPDAYADPRFNQAVDRQTGYRTRSILAVPLLGHDGELVGVAQVLNKHGGPFTAEDEELAQALASQAAVAMKRGRLIEDRLIREKLERDIELARRIQQSSFPAELPVLPGFDVAAWSQPAEETGGDVYDVIARITADPTSDSSAAPITKIVLLMADATGHGVGPALSVTQLRSMLRMAVRLGADLTDIARHANQQLCDDLPGGRFITAWFGELDSKHHTLTSLSAGQAPLLRYIAAEDRFDSADADVVPLGVIDLVDLVPSTPLVMNNRDIFAVISDGIFESRNAAGQQFGSERVQSCLRKCRDRSAADMIASLRSSVEEFTQNQPAEDDRTAILIKRTAANS